VRAVSSRIADAELTFLDRVPIDLERARAQHLAYVGTLRDLGLDVLQAPLADDHPDGVFVEDAVVVVDDLAVLTTPGAASRRAEPATLVALLRGAGLELVAIGDAGTLDGGDVLQVGRTVYVGRTRRTDDGGIRRLAELLRARGRDVVPVDVTGALHLKTSATALPDGTILAVPEWLDVTAFGDREVVAVPEPAGADVLLVGVTVVLSSSAPRTAALIAERGWTVRTVEIDEFEKAEAGPTCLSVVLA
jgi:dimethylargininase